MIEVTKILKKGVESGDFPGAGYAVIYKDGFIDYDFVGYRQILPKKILNTGEEIYDCASITKVICTTTMIMKLIESNKLTLDTKVSSILSRFMHKDISIYHLLTHSSGLPADITRAKTLKSREDVLNRIYDYQLINTVGTTIVYSDLGFILLGLIIEKLTKKTLDVFAKKVIFDPLGMAHSSYHPDPSMCAPTEFRDDDVYKGLLQGRVHDEKAFALGGIAGHAGLFSTPNDISLFILSILNNDSKVLQPATVEMLFPMRIKNETEDKTLVRSLGWDKPTKGGTAGDLVSFEDTILHTGFTGCNIWIERSVGIGFVMLSNAVHPKRNLNNIIKYRNKIGNIVISKKET